MSPRQSPQSLNHAADRRVRVIENAWIELSDGVRLAIRLWLPEDAETRPVSAILDSVPYRKSDGTAIWDATWGTYFAARGFAFARVDLRGSGDSSGILEDEYTEQEQRDTEQVLAWLAARPWCTGAVGMIGISWGGFAALQMAARHPEQLRGVVAVHASDDRYADDVHYVGGCVSAMDITQWATSMLAYLNQPPDPAVVGSDWRDAWLARLENAKPWIEPWLSHQRRDDYWRQGSACEDYGAIRCPVFAVGGWSDGYRDMVLRVVEHVSRPRARSDRTVGAHESREGGARSIDRVSAGVRALLRRQPRRRRQRLLRRAAPDQLHAGAGRSRRLIRRARGALGRGPVVAVAGRRRVDARRSATNALHEPEDAGGPAAAARSLRGLQGTGVDGGVWCGDGSPADFALDQRPDDGASLCWDTAPLAERVELLGRGEAQLR